MKALACAVAASRSTETATTCAPFGPCAFWKAASVGISFLHGAHHVAHRFRNTTLPLKAVSETGLPAASRKGVGGAGGPLPAA